MIKPICVSSLTTTWARPNKISSKGAIALSFLLLINTLASGAANAQDRGPVPIELDSPQISSPRPNNAPSQPGTIDRSLDVERSPAPGSISNSSTRFSCQRRDGQFLVMYQPKSQSGQYFPWASPANMGGGWSTERRCNEISRRLEQYRPDGLVEMRTSTENGYNIICATTEQNAGCRIILTVPVGSDPISIRDRIFANLTTADSGQMTTAVNTFVPRSGNNSGILGALGLPTANNQNIRLPRSSDRRRGIDLKPFLDPADGGTGTGLVGGYNEAPGLRFQPERLR
jgi:hypothetical protein